ncbi:hypothetical protein ACOMHN_005191 [Nucella lapillus]
MARVTESNKRSLESAELVVCPLFALRLLRRVVKQWSEVFKLLDSSAATFSLRQYYSDSGAMPQEGTQRSTVTWLYHQLCRETTQTAILHGSGRSCYWHSTHLAYVKFKAEVVNSDPSIIIFHDVIHNEEIVTLKNLSFEKLAPSTLLATKVAHERHLVRVSQTAWLLDSVSPVVSRVSQRVQLVTGHSTKILADTTHAEPYQVVNYGIGGVNGLHEDSVRVLRSEGQENHPMLQQSGDRLATWMFYLSEVPLGGATVFPLLGAGIRPEKGAAVLWYNVKRNGEGDVRMVHAGCPVLRGDKWGIRYTTGTPQVSGTPQVPHKYQVHHRYPTGIRLMGDVCVRYRVPFTVT